MLQVFARAVEALPPPRLAGNSPPFIVAFGSFGRLDGDPAISDYDVLYLYPGRKNISNVRALQGYIRELVSTNKALPFDHRAEIESNKFKFDASPAYPILSTDELRKTIAAVRQLQMLTEGRAINEPAKVLETRKTLLESLGYTDNLLALNLSPLRDSLDSFKGSYCTQFLGSLHASAHPRRNRKILKLFTLREFSYLSSVFSVADIAIATSSRAAPLEGLVQMLSAPSVLKIASFADESGSLATLFHTLPPPLKQELREIIRDHVKAISPDKLVGMPKLTDGDADLFFTGIRLLVLNILHVYDLLLYRLHDKSFLAQIDLRGPDVATWIAVPPFPSILASRAQLIAASRALAASLCDVLECVARRKHCPAVADALLSLQRVREYQLALADPGA